MNKKNQTRTTQNSLHNVQISQKLKQQAIQAFQQTDLTKSILLFNQAHKKSPDDFMLQLDLGRAHLLSHNLAKANSIFTEVLKKTDRNPAAILHIAESYHTFPRYDLAEPYYQELINTGKAGTSIYCIYAETLERLHKPEEAKNILNLAAKKSPNHPRITLFLAQLMIRERNHDQAHQTLTNLIQSPDLDFQTKWQSQYTLATTLDKQGAHDKAIDALKTAKNLLLPSAQNLKPQIRKLQSEHKKALSSLNAPHFLRWTDHLEQLQPKANLAMLCGHPRSGTTLLEQILDAHSQAICMDETEIYTHSIWTNLRNKSPRSQTAIAKLSHLNTKTVNLCRHDYLQMAAGHLDQDLKNTLLIDKNPGLTAELTVTCTIFPESKIIFPIRDPRDVVISCYMQKLNLSLHSIAYLDLKSTCQQYASIMDTWLKIKPMINNPWIEIHYEDLVSNPEIQTRKTLELLNLPWEPSIMNFTEKSKTKAINSPTYNEAKEEIHTRAVGRWKNYKKHLEPHLHILQPYIQEFGYE